jgi:tetratricopeptide (TPR) repeat protein
MKALFLAVSAAALTATVPASASSIMTVGGSFARSCYLSAESRDATPASIAECNRALGEQAMSDQDRLATHVNRGILRMIKGDFELAKADFEEAVEMNPNHPEPWLNTAILRFKQGDSAAAVPLFDRAIQLHTRRPEIAYYGRALAHEDAGNVKAAYADLRRAVALRPNWAEPKRDLARYRVRSR